MDAVNERFSGYADVVTSLDEIRDVIGEPRPQIVAKVIDHLSDICRDFVEKSPFALIASSNSSGQCDVSPRGDPIGFVQVLDDKHLAIPDRPGNKLAATFGNLIENPHLALIFLIPGKLETLRVNGEARIVRDEAIRKRLASRRQGAEFRNHRCTLSRRRSIARNAWSGRSSGNPTPGPTQAEWPHSPRRPTSMPSRRT